MKFNRFNGYVVALFGAVFLLSACSDVSYQWPRGYAGNDSTPHSSPYGAIMDGEDAEFSIIDNAEWEFAANDMVAELVNRSDLKGMAFSIAQFGAYKNEEGMLFDNYLHRALMDAGFDIIENSDFQLIYDVDDKNAENNIEIMLGLYMNDKFVIKFSNDYKINLAD